MKNLLGILLFLSTVSLFAQDKIVLINGKVLDCKILSIDTAGVSVNLHHKNNQIPYFLKHHEVESLVWNSNSEGFAAYLTLKGYEKGKDTTEQIDGNHLYLFSGKIIPGKNIELKDPFFGSRYFSVDGEKHKDAQVKFFQNDEGYFANTIPFSHVSSSTFAKRIKKGRINLFEQTNHGATNMAYGYGVSPGFGGYGMNGPVGGFGVGISLPTTTFYYNKGFENIKKIDFYGLRDDMADDPLALSALNHWNKTRKNGNLFMISGILFTGISFAAFISKVTESENPNVTIELIGLSIGTASLWVKYFGWDQGMNPKNLKQAIEIYNR